MKKFFSATLFILCVVLLGSQSQSVEAADQYLGVYEDGRENIIATTKANISSAKATLARSRQFIPVRIASTSISITNINTALKPKVFPKTVSCIICAK